MLRKYLAGLFESQMYNGLSKHECSEDEGKSSIAQSEMEELEGSREQEDGLNLNDEIKA